jgi:hypothetical protein
LKIAEAGLKGINIPKRKILDSLTKENNGG